MELEGAEAAARASRQALAQFRKEGKPVFHVRHLSARPGSTFFIPGTERRGDPCRVRRIEGEAVIEKNFPEQLSRHGARARC